MVPMNIGISGPWAIDISHFSFTEMTFFTLILHRVFFWNGRPKSFRDFTLRKSSRLYPLSFPTHEITKS
jgi:hypothetical protein